MTLRTKIIGGTLALLLFASLSTVLVMHLLVSTRLERELVKRGESIGRHLALSSIHSIVTEDVLSLQLMTNRIEEEEEDIVYLFIYDREGAVMAGFSEGDEVLPHPRSESFPGINKVKMGEFEAYDISVPIGEGQLGDVHLGLSTAAVRVSLRNVMQLGTSLVLLTTLILAILAVTFDQQVTAPVSRLTGAAGSIRAGDFETRLPVDTRDELGGLAQAFNSMADRIGSSRQELVEANRELEQEIIEHRDAEVRVREREKELRTIIESTPVMMALVDGSGKVRKINHSWSLFTGSSEDDIRTLPVGNALRCVSALGHPGGCGLSQFCEDCMVKATVWGAIEKGMAHRQVEASIPRDKGGGLAHLLVSATPISVTGEKMVLVSIEDISPLKTAQLQLNDAFHDLERQNEELRKLDRIKDMLIRDVSHELKTPVAKFSMQFEMIKSRLGKEGLTGRLESLLRDVETNIHRQEKVIRNLLDLSRLEAGERRFSVGPMRLDVLLGKIIDEHRSFLELYGLRITADLEEMEIESDEDMLWHVFSNLIGNAIKFTRDNPEGRIRIRTERKGDTVTVRVADNGIGLSAEQKSRAFDRFYQVSASQEGIGVGLPLSRMIIEGLGGAINLDSEGEGLGATAAVTLPLAAAPTGAGIPKKPSRVETALGT